MKQKIKTLKFIVPLFVLLSVLGCNVEEEVILSESSREYKMKTISLEEFNEKLSFIKNKPSIEGFMRSSGSSLVYAKFSSNDFEIMTDVIKEVTLDDNYTSYTMLLKTPDSDATNLYNITVEETNGISSLFIVKYEGYDEVSQTYNGDVSTYRIAGDVTDESRLKALLTQVFDSIPDSSSGNNDPVSSGGSGEYPTNCNGYVKLLRSLQK